MSVFIDTSVPSFILYRETPFQTSLEVCNVAHLSMKTCHRAHSLLELFRPSHILKVSLKAGKKIGTPFYICVRDSDTL